MDYVSAVLDLVKALLALGLFVYAMRLHQTFRGGMMARSFKFLMVAPLLFAVTEVINMLRNLGVAFFEAKMIADSFEILFMAALFIGFYLLASSWRIKN